MVKRPGVWRPKDASEESLAPADVFAGMPNPTPRAVQRSIGETEGFAVQGSKPLVQ
jgi:hypothetical protein